MPIDPMLNPNRNPTKEDLKEFLGIARYRRFDVIYEELIDMKLHASFVWSELEKIWFVRFYNGKTPLFSIRWGVDYFYAHVLLDAKPYKKVVRHKDITPDAMELVQKNPPNPTKQNTRVEANLEMMKDQEAFFNLLPVLIQVLG